VGTLVGPMSVSACKPLRPMKFEKKSTVIETLEKSKQLQDIFNKLRNEGYNVNIKGLRAVENKDNILLDIPIEKSGVNPTKELLLAIEDGKIKSIVTVSKKVVTNGVLYRFTNENGEEHCLIVKDNSRKLDIFTLTDEGYPLWGPDWECVGMCLTDFCIQNWWYCSGCWSLIYFCILDLTKATCLAALTCVGPVAGFCLAQCWRWW